MKGGLLIAAIVLTASTWLAADEPGILFSNQGAPSRDAASPEKDQAPNATTTDEATPAAEEADGQNAAPRIFYPTAHCENPVPALDRWFDNEPPWFTTDQWLRNPCEGSSGNCYRNADGTWVCDDKYCDVFGRPMTSHDAAVRFGWWGVSSRGSPTKVGEYQDLRSSPFFDIDSVFNDGQRSLDLTLSGFDNEANNARAKFYTPSVSGQIKYQRFLRRLDHDPVPGTPFLPGTPYPPGGQFLPPGVLETDAAANVRGQDLNVGQDYAIRVQQFDARFKGRISDNIKWRLNVWGQRKFGERQTTATAHCFNVLDTANGPPNTAPGANGNACHVLSQRQSIDWFTLDIQPAVEAKFGDVTVEYSRTMRSFNQGDQSVGRSYTRFNYQQLGPPGAAGLPNASTQGFIGPDYLNAVVPESMTNIDRLKVGAKLGEDNNFYGNLYNGDTKDEFRDTHRRIHGLDLRLTNRSIEGMTVTAYGTLDVQKNELPSVLFDQPPLGAPGAGANSAGVVPANTKSPEEEFLRHPVNYNRSRYGVNGNWRPFYDSGKWDSEFVPWRHLLLTGGYEYMLLARDFATYDTALGPFTQPDTKRHQIQFGPSMQWSPAFNSFARYKGRFYEDPLVGVRANNGRFNTNQPEQEHGVDLGGTWTPTTNFMATAQFSLVNRLHKSKFANFTENDYPIITTLWYAPTERLSLTGGYAYFSNWIDQDITLGFTTPGVPAPPVRTETTRWNYAGQNHLVSLSAQYQWTPSVQLIGGYEWNWGSNTFSVPPSPAGADWSLLPTLGDVIVKTQRVTAGVDWQASKNMNTYFRYVLFDYDDKSAGLDSGIAHMFLAGLSYVR